MAVQTSALNLGRPLVATGNWRSRTLTIILMVGIALFFWVDSRYPALMKRYHAGTQVKRVVGIKRGSWKDRVIQTARAVITAEIKAERILSLRRT